LRQQAERRALEELHDSRRGVAPTARPLRALHQRAGSGRRALLHEVACDDGPRREMVHVHVPSPVRIVLSRAGVSIQFQSGLGVGLKS
jgi:hypothetical protein